MATKEVREIEHIAGDKPDDGKEYLHTNIGFTRAADVKYEIYWLLPVTDIKEELLALSEECKDRYDCNLVDLIESGVRQLTTRPDYKGVGFTDAGELKENGHSFMQDMADNYKVGARVAGEGIKSKAKKLDSLLERTGASSIEELEAKLAKLEAQGLLK
uniref:Uncharacterized protein n=1 Tax=viral metagenome TaxID=1070528 RepID=A0A6H1ZDJ9_9ZZZZ